MGITIDPSMHNSQPNSFPAVSLFDLISDTPQEANNIMELIEGRIGLDGELIKDAKNSKFVSSSSNSAFGLLVLALGDKDRAEKIREGIERRIGFDGELVRVGETEKRELFTRDNALYGLFVLALGDKDRAEEIRNGIERRIGFEIFIRHSDRDRRVLYQSLIPYALLNLSLGEEKGLVTDLRDYIHLDTLFGSNLIGAGPKDSGIISVPNCLKFLLDFSLGLANLGHIEEIKEEIGLEDGLIKGGVNYNRILSLPNSLYALSNVPNKFLELISHRGG